MWTISYKGLFIQGYCDMPFCRVTDIRGRVYRECKSLHAAKLYITKSLNYRML